MYIVPRVVSSKHELEAHSFQGENEMEIELVEESEAWPNSVNASGTNELSPRQAT